VVGFLVAHGALDWSLKASLIAGTTLSTTSIAVVYAVLVEDGLSGSSLGKLLMSATFVTLLMSTGLTFGSIASLYALDAGIIDATQYSLLIGVVIGTAVIPTVITQTLFAPIGDLEYREHPVPAEGYV
jgi:Kef-type K+ transport system membrane component KefB